MYTNSVLTINLRPTGCCPWLGASKTGGDDDGDKRCPPVVVFTADAEDVLGDAGDAGADVLAVATGLLFELGAGRE